MPRTAITVQVLPANGGEIEDVTFSAMDAANDHEFENTGKELVFIKNGSGGSLDVDPVAPADKFGRTVLAGGKTISTGASEQSVAGPYDPEVFNQSNGSLMHLDLTDSTSMTVAVVRFP